MNATREMILKNARELFNLHGYSKVSLRMIAAQCGIASGNLTYHFPRKQDIADALMRDDLTATLPERPITCPEDLMEQFSLMLDALERNAFYFLDDEFLEASKVQNRRILQRIRKGIADMAASGQISPDFTEDRQNAVLHLLMMAHLEWLRSKVRSKGPDKETFLNMHRTVLEPYLIRKEP